VLGRYCGRRSYQVVLAAGGARVDLDGKPNGEVTAAEQEAARGVIARMDAITAERAVAAKAERAAERAASKAQAKPPAKSKSVLTPESGPKQPIRLADLKRAALARQQAARRHGSGPEPHLTFEPAGRQTRPIWKYSASRAADRESTRRDSASPRRFRQ
jgi:sRNA-binding protein